MSHPMTSWTRAALVLLLLAGPFVLSSGRAAAADRSIGACHQCGAHGQLVARTIMVPTWVSETRMESKVVKKSVEREEKYTVFQRAPVTRKFSTECWYLDNDVKTQTITEKNCHLVQNPAELTKHIKVPETECRTETVCREVCNADGSVTVIEEPCVREVTVLRDDVQTSSCVEPQVVFDETKRDITYLRQSSQKVRRPVQRRNGS